MWSSWAVESFPLLHFTVSQTASPLGVTSYMGALQGKTKNRKEMMPMTVVSFRFNSLVPDTTARHGEPLSADVFERADTGSLFPLTF